MCQTIEFYEVAEKKMPTFSLTREIKLTNEDALKIMDSEPSEELQAILKFMERQETTHSKENKLSLKYLSR